MTSGISRCTLCNWTNPLVTYHNAEPPSSPGKNPGTPSVPLEEHDQRAPHFRQTVHLISALRCPQPGAGPLTSLGWTIDGVRQSTVPKYAESQMKVEKIVWFTVKNGDSTWSIKKIWRFQSLHLKWGLRMDQSPWGNFEILKSANTGVSILGWHDVFLNFTHRRQSLSNQTGRFWYDILPELWMRQPANESIGWRWILKPSQSAAPRFRRNASCPRFAALAERHPLLRQGGSLPLHEGWFRSYFRTWGFSHCKNMFVLSQTGKKEKQWKTPRPGKILGNPWQETGSHETRCQWCGLLMDNIQRADCFSVLPSRLSESWLHKGPIGFRSSVYCEMLWQVWKRQTELWLTHGRSQSYSSLLGDILWNVYRKASIGSVKTIWP